MVQYFGFSIKIHPAPDLSLPHPLRTSTIVNEPFLVTPVTLPSIDGAVRMFKSSINTLTMNGTAGNFAAEAYGFNTRFVCFAIGETD
jgi:hypothetical protein